MALIYKQTVVQETTQGISERMIVQYYDDVALENKQVIVNYDSLSAEDKTIFDDFKTLSESKMV